MIRTGGLTRIERARVIRDVVVAAGRTRGRWESVDLGDGQTARFWMVEGEGWTANVSTRFSGLSSGVEVKDYDEAMLLQIAPPREDDVLVDVYHPAAGKVLSIGNTGEVDTLIGMQPGPWEAMFGLPVRAWSPAVARRLAAKTPR